MQHTFQRSLTHTCWQSVTRVCIRVFRNLITNFAPLILKLYTKLRVSSAAAQAPPYSSLEPPVPASCRTVVLRIGNDHNGLNCQQQREQLPVWLQLWCGCLRLHPSPRPCLVYARMQHIEKGNASTLQPFITANFRN